MSAYVNLPSFFSEETEQEKGRVDLAHKNFANFPLGKPSHLAKAS